MALPGRPCPTASSHAGEGAGEAKRRGLRHAQSRGGITVQLNTQTPRGHPSRPALQALRDYHNLQESW